MRIYTSDTPETEGENILPEAVPEPAKVVLGLVSDRHLAYQHAVDTSPDKPWIIEAWDEPEIVDTAVKGVECIRCRDFNFINVDVREYMEPDPTAEKEGKMRVSLDAIAEAIAPLASIPGNNIFLIEGCRMTPEEFFEKFPPHSEAIDGFASGDRKVQWVGKKATRQVTDHHGRRRNKLPCASTQAYQEEMDGTAHGFALEDGKPVRNMFINHRDLDSIMTLFARVYGRRLQDGQGLLRARQLFRHENVMDTKGAWTQELKLEDIADLNYVMAPMGADKAKSSGRNAFDHLRDGFQNAQEYIRTEGKRAPLKVDYKVLNEHLNRSWSTVWEETPVARRRMLDDGRRDEFMLIAKGQKPDDTEEKEPTMKEYTLQKYSTISQFPLGPGLYGFMNYLTMLLPKDTASKEAVLGYLNTLPPDVRNFAQYKGPFGGSDTIGGGKTTINWKVLDAGIEWFVTQYARTPQNVRETPEREIEEFVRAGMQEKLAS